MNNPVTTIDTRFSDPNAVATGWDETQHALETAEIFWISTVRTDGRPHVTPLVAVWYEGGAIHFCTGSTEQKSLNIHENPQVILTTGCNHWDDGLDVVVEGTAIQVTDTERLKRLAEVWTTKWDGRWQFKVQDGFFYHSDGEEAPQNTVPVFSVTPTRILAFARGTFGQTRYQF